MLALTVDPCRVDGLLFSKNKDSMRIPDRFLNCVGFVSHRQDQPKYVGTAFIVGVKGKYGNAYLHVITAKHVAEVIQGRSFLIGMNFKDGEAGWFGSSMKWWYHPTDKSVDAAATVFTPTARMDMDYIPETAFVTDEVIRRYDIGVGDQLSIVGLFTQFHGRKKHIPIVRTGNIAMMPSDKIPADDGESEVYLAETRSIGGLSGSPVFVRHTVRLENLASEDGELQTMSGLGHHHFLGLMRGHWDLPMNLQGYQAEAVNMGISIIVPAKKILEVLYHPELVALRARQDQQISKESLPALDQGA